jgi:hypothetical protein
MTLRLLSTIDGMALVNYWKTLRALIATLTLGSFICLLRTSMTLELDLCCANASWYLRQV